MKLIVFWFRRDLRIADNIALSRALAQGLPVLPLFILDEDIISKLPKDDARIGFIYEQLFKINEKLKAFKSALLVHKGKVKDVFDMLTAKYEITGVFANEDYEPSALARDKSVSQQLAKRGVEFHLFKDHVIFHPNEILKPDGNPYKVYTAYKKRWIEELTGSSLDSVEMNFSAFVQDDFRLHPLEHYGFKPSLKKVKDPNWSTIERYHNCRDYPAADCTSHLGPHLRFGTVSARQALKAGLDRSEEFVNELIWREFFMQVLFHFPHAAENNFNAKYNFLQWRNKEEEFEKWSSGRTGFPLIDAGMIELKKTGYMHNRVRMLAASFLAKHLLIDWRWGEAYFALHLLDYEMASNNGNWQWAAGVGCDAAPYFRVFNPETQLAKFDPQFEYVKKHIPAFRPGTYLKPMLDHKMARLRAIAAYKKALDEAS